MKWKVIEFSWESRKEKIPIILWMRRGKWKGKPFKKAEDANTSSAGEIAPKNQKEEKRKEKNNHCCENKFKSVLEKGSRNPQISLLFLLLSSCFLSLLESVDEWMSRIDASTGMLLVKWKRNKINGIPR